LSKLNITAHDGMIVALWISWQWCAAVSEPLAAFRTGGRFFCG
jgi:hypothetical protein